MIRYECDNCQAKGVSTVYDESRWCPFCGKRAMRPTFQRHADDYAVARFGLAMRNKMAASRAKGRSGWQTASPRMLARILAHHLTKRNKGNYVDLACLCMMLHETGAPADALAEVLAEQLRQPEGLERFVSMLRGLGRSNSDAQNARLRAVVQSVAREQFHVLPWNDPPCRCHRCALIREARAALLTGGQDNGAS